MLAMKCLVAKIEKLVQGRAEGINIFLLHKEACTSNDERDKNDIREIRRKISHG